MQLEAGNMVTYRKHNGAETTPAIKATSGHHNEVSNDLAGDAEATEEAMSDNRGDSDNGIVGRDGLGENVNQGNSRNGFSDGKVDFNGCNGHTDDGARRSVKSVAFSGDTESPVQGRRRTRRDSGRGGMDDKCDLGEDGEGGEESSEYEDAPSDNDDRYTDCPEDLGSNQLERELTGETTRDTPVSENGDDRDLVEELADMIGDIDDDYMSGDLGGGVNGDFGGDISGDLHGDLGAGDEVVERYQLTKKIGTGTFGEVYLATALHETNCFYYYS